MPRRLDSFEEVFWHFEQVHPYAPVFAVELDGWISPENWTEHLRTVQSRYPLLRARINKIPGQRPSFEPTNHIEIPFRRAPLDKDDRVETAMERELVIGFGDGNGALARVSLLHASDRAILLLAAHHAAFDGRTMMMIVEDLLRAASGKPLGAPFEGAADICQLFSLPENNGYSTLLGEVIHSSSSRVKDVHVERVFLSEALTASVLSECKARCVNVRALVAATLAEAGREDRIEWQSRPVTVASPIDLRPMLNHENTPGLLIGLGSAVVPAATSRQTLWQTASNLGQAFQHTANVEAQKLRSLKLREFLDHERLPHAFMQTWQTLMPSPDIMINNYGQLPLQEDYDDFSIKTISSGSIASLGLTQKVSMISLRGKIGICIATCDPIDGILAKTSAILSEACDSSRG